MSSILMEIANERSTFRKIGFAPGSASHDVVFAIRQLSLQSLDLMLLERSSPQSNQYQQWLNFDEIGKLFDSFSSASLVISWLSSNGAQVTWHSPHWTYVVARATLSTWQELLNTTFYLFEDLEYKGTATKFYRSHSYSLPPFVAEHVFCVLNTVQVPPVILPRYRERGERIRVERAMLRWGKRKLSTGPVTVSFLDSYYQITKNYNNGSSRVSQSVFETNQEYYSPSDLTLFQQQYGLTVQAAVDYNGFNTSSACSLTGGSPSCTEGNLDIQYIMGMAQVSTSIYWYTSPASSSTFDAFTTWILAVASDPNPPQSNSISWGAYEYSVSASIQNTWNIEASKLGLQGVTIMSASGDDGAPNISNGGTCMCSANSGYNPVFPAVSPYTTAVGATMGPQDNSPEVACQSQLGGVITSGGGFSSYNSRPSWQNKAVTTYFSTVQGTTSAPVSGYNTNGRGYPDVALLGVNYQVVIAGKTVGVYGTSCSTPVFAAFITLLNGQRKSQGLNTVGFINPTLYNYSSRAGTFNDITSGSNKCCAYTGSNYNLAQCCSSGFAAVKGWDPVTGLGSITYPNLAALFKVNVSYQSSTASSGGSNGTTQLSTIIIALICGAGVLGLGLMGIFIGVIWRHKFRNARNERPASESFSIGMGNIYSSNLSAHRENRQQALPNPIYNSPSSEKLDFNSTEEDVSALQDLGFTRDQALAALKESGYNLQRAALILTRNRF